MNRAAVFAAAAVLAAGSMAFAGGDKSAAPFADLSSVNGGANGFTNGTSTGVSKSAGCTVQIQLKGVTGLADGDQVICIGSADVLNASLPSGVGGNSVVWRVPAKSGQIKIKNSVAVLDVAGNHCGSAKSVSFNANTACYKPDPGYDPAAACPLPTQLWIPAPAGTVNLLGLCQGLSGAPGQRIGNPSSGKIAETGMTILQGAK